MNELFDIKDKTAVVTGGYGALGSSIAGYLATQGVKTAIVGRRAEEGDKVVREIVSKGGEAAFFKADVLNMDDLKKGKEDILSGYGKIDILINVAGGNVPGATIQPDRSFFQMQAADWKKVTELNLDGTIFPTIVFGEAIADQKYGSIINISSMSAYSAITQVVGYSAAKAAISNFTQWLAAETAIKYGDKVRVNAIAPGFFIGSQNRALLLNSDGSLTERSRKIIAGTPMGRFGDITELNGVIQFLCSEAASFITGAVLPVDGGFSSFSGV
jgi:NAD(P)-dependent dehydrogenase (short-subunit alcohol dehydrogenase family)